MAVPTVMAFRMGHIDGIVVQRDDANEVDLAYLADVLEVNFAPSLGEVGGAPGGGDESSAGVVIAGGMAGSSSLLRAKAAGPGQAAGVPERHAAAAAVAAADPGAGLFQSSEVYSDAEASFIVTMEQTVYDPGGGPGDPLPKELAYQLRDYLDLLHWTLPAHWKLHDLINDLRTTSTTTPSSRAARIYSASSTGTAIPATGPNGAGPVPRASTSTQEKRAGSTCSRNSKGTAAACSECSTLYPSVWRGSIPSCTATESAPGPPTPCPSCGASSDPSTLDLRGSCDGCSSTQPTAAPLTSANEWSLSLQTPPRPIQAGGICQFGSATCTIRSVLASHLQRGRKIRLRTRLRTHASGQPPSIVQNVTRSLRGGTTKNCTGTLRRGIGPLDSRIHALL